MFDFTNSINLTEELKNKEIYNLFKTDSSEFNNKLSSALQKYQNIQQLINNYSKIDINHILNAFNNISLISSQIVNLDNKNINNSEIESYMFGISNILLFLCLIQKNNQLLINLITNVKLYVYNFFSNNKNESILKEKIDSFINDLINSSQMIEKRSYSRRSTNEVTNCSICMNFENKKKNPNFNLDNKQDLFRSFTPKFENNEEMKIPKNTPSIIEENIKISSSKNMDSSLTLQKMNFVQINEEEIKKNKTIKIFNTNNINKNVNDNKIEHESKTFIRKKNKSQSTKVNIKGCLINKSRKHSVNSVDNRYTQNERIKILAEILDSINILFKEKKINSNQKISMKQIIISNPKIIIDKFYQSLKNMKSAYDNSLMNKNIQIFLLEEFKGV